MDYGRLSENIMNKLHERQEHLRILENEEEKRVRSLFFGQENYKREYYKDLFALENKLKKFTRNDILFNEADMKKKQKLDFLMAERKSLKSKEDVFYQQIENNKGFPYQNRTPNTQNFQSLDFHQPMTTQTPQRNIWENRKNLVKDMSFDQLKDYRLLKEKLPSMDELKNDHLLQLQKYFNKSPYSNNVLNILQQNSVSSEKHIVTYLKALQNDASLQTTMFRQGSPEYFEKQKQIEILGQMLQFIEKKNPFKPQKELVVDPFDSEQAFYINWDFVKVVPSYVKRIKINYGIFKKESTYFTYRGTSDIYTQNPNYLDSSSERFVALINEQHVIKHLMSRENAILYFDMWVWDESDEKVSKYGWSLLDIFDNRGNFLPGKYKAPFYPKDIKPHSLFQNGLRYLQNNCFCFVNLQTSKQAFDLNAQQFNFENEYFIPPLHQKPPREEILYQPDALSIFTSPDDMPHFGIVRRAKADLAALTFESIIKQCQEVILELPAAQTNSSFSQISQTGEKDNRKGFEFSITGFNNVFFPTTDFLKVKGVFMKFDKIIIDEQNKSTVNQGMALINSREGPELKCEFAYHFKIDFDKLNISGYQEDQQSAEKEHENEYYLFYCLYNHADKLIGWTDIDLFDVEDGKILLKEGKFVLQLFNPPLLLPPFLNHEKTTSILEIKYEISGNQTVKEKKKKDDEKKLVTIAAARRGGKVDNSDLLKQQEIQLNTNMAVDNPKQFIKIEISSLKFYSLSKNTIGCFIKFLLPPKVLKDLDKKNLQEFDSLEVQSTGKDIISFSHERDFKVNIFSLKEQVTDKEREKAIIQFELVLANKKNEHIGILEIPLFPNGYDIRRNESKTLFKKNKDKLTPLKYSLQYKIDVLEREEKVYDTNQGFKIEISSISNYRDKYNIYADLVVYSGSDAALNSKGDKIIIEQKVASKPDTKEKKALFDQILEVALNVQMLKDKKSKELYKMYAVIILSIEKTVGKKEEYGWYAQPLFTTDNIFFEGNFDELLFKPPFVPNFPFDVKKQRKLLSKIQFEIKEVKVSN